MRRVLRVLGILAITALTFAVGLSAWLYFYNFYTADLPSTSQLNEFNALSESQTLLRSCDGTEQAVLAMPGEKLGRYTVAALIAAEGKPDTTLEARLLHCSSQQTGSTSAGTNSNWREASSVRRVRRYATNFSSYGSPTQSTANSVRRSF
jgi:hypothetical protein